MKTAQALSRNMKARLLVARRLLEEARVSGRPLPVLTDGVRPDVALVSDRHVHPALLRYLAAHHGMVSDSPEVVAFNAHESGPHRVHILDFGVDRDAAVGAIKRAGAPSVTVHKNTAYVFDDSGQLNLTPILESVNASRYHSVAGTGRVIGAGQGASPADRRAHYRDTIRAAESLAASAAGGGSEGDDPSPVKLARSHTSTSPNCPHCGSDDTWSKKMDGTHECRECFEGFTDAEADKALRPGQEGTDGDPHEPDQQPDLVEYVVNKVGGGEAVEHTNHGTGFITPDGRGVQMGPHSMRYEDHRTAIPTHGAMTRWGWPEDVLRHYAEATRTPALHELMKRSGLLRFHSDSSGQVVVSMASKPTRAQVEAIQRHLITHRSKYLVIHPVGGKESEHEGGDLMDAGKHLTRAGNRVKLSRTFHLNPDEEAFPAKYLAKRKRTLGPLAALADYLIERGHGDRHPVKWLAHIVTHPDVEVTTLRHPFMMGGRIHYDWDFTDPKRPHHLVMVRGTGKTIRLRAPIQSRAEAMEAVAAFGSDSSWLGDRRRDQAHAAFPEKLSAAMSLSPEHQAFVRKYASQRRKSPSLGPLAALADHMAEHGHGVIAKWLTHVITHPKLVVQKRSGVPYFKNRVMTRLLRSYTHPSGLTHMVQIATKSNVYNLFAPAEDREQALEHLEDTMSQTPQWERDQYTRLLDENLPDVKLSAAMSLSPEHQAFVRKFASQRGKRKHTIALQVLADKLQEDGHESLGKWLRHVAAHPKLTVMPFDNPFVKNHIEHTVSAWGPTARLGDKLHHRVVIRGKGKGWFLYAPVDDRATALEHLGDLPGMNDGDVGLLRGLVNRQFPETPPDVKLSAPRLPVLPAVHYFTPHPDLGAHAATGAMTGEELEAHLRKTIGYDHPIDRILHHGGGLTVRRMGGRVRGEQRRTTLTPEVEQRAIHLLIGAGMTFAGATAAGASFYAPVPTGKARMYVDQGGGGSLLVPHQGDWHVILLATNREPPPHPAASALTAARAAKVANKILRGE